MAGVGDAAAWVALRVAPKIGDVVGRRLSEQLGGPAAVLAASEAALLAAGCPPVAARRFDGAAALAEAHREIARVRDVGARVVSLDDDEYPPLLRELHDAPLVLIARGLPLAPGPAVAIVGARAATAYGLAVARALAEELTHAGLTIVSGLARGIDGAAHEGALTARGRTVAVLGSGIDVIYPPEHAELAAGVIAAGTLLSERPVGAVPMPAHFPARNRILAGMTQGTVVIEAAERSGSLITARLANEAGREVFAVPGRVDSPLSAGAHLLIRQGATLVRDVDDVLEQLTPALRARAETSGGSAVIAPRTGDDDEPLASLVDLLAGGVASLDELIRLSSRPSGEIVATLLDLELRGVVRQLAGRRFQLTGRFAGVGGLQ
jgi:DNA processing protein